MPALTPWPSSADRRDASAPTPVTIVIFGGAGDLAHRKLLPALYNLHVDGLLPARFAVVGVGRKADDRRGVPRVRARTASTQFSRRPLDDAAWQTLRAALFFVNGSIDGSSGVAAARRAPRHRSSTSAACPATASTTSRCRRRCSCRRSSSSRARGSSARPTPPFARLIVEKPIGHDLASARAINDAIAAVFDERQIFRIDHYLGQGDGPEHPGPALRQQHLRAAVQPEVHRPRADHRRRGGRRRHARRLLRAGRRAARHGAEPHAAAARAGGDGAAAFARRRRRARREARGDPVAAADRRRGGRRPRRPRAVRGRLRARRAGARLPRRSRASIRSRAPRPSSRCRSSSTTGAGPACRSSCAPASGCRSARARSPST